MSRVRRAAAITFVTGALGGAALVAAEAAAARLRRYAQPDPHLAMRTSIGDAASPALRLVLLGDASALGVGVDRVADTVGGHLAELLAGGAATNRRPIQLASLAVGRAPGGRLRRRGRAGVPRRRRYLQSRRSPSLRRRLPRLGPRPVPRRRRSGRCGVSLTVVEPAYLPRGSLTPCRKLSSSPPPVPRSAAPSRAPSPTCVPTTSPPRSSVRRWRRYPSSTRTRSTTCTSAAACPAASRASTWRAWWRCSSGTTSCRGRRSPGTAP